MLEGEDVIANRKVFVRKLEVMEPPLPKSGGRVHNSSGEIAQIINDFEIKYIAYIDFIEDSKTPRGNHYHQEKDEYLYIIKGKLKAIYVDIETEEREEFLFETGDIINTKPKCAHVYFPLEYTQLLEFSPNVYDPSDTRKYIVV
ncbi:MAG: cupin domain-containing protein [Anaerolineae bacterium]|nr:cupin domain-containing protein [Anaerolineae bacterium]